MMFNFMKKNPIKQSHVTVTTTGTAPNSIDPNDAVSGVTPGFGGAPSIDISPSYVSNTFTTAGS